MILNLYKERGETPLERVQRFVAKNPEHKNEKITYLGRLDPMAHGVMLVATGEDVKRKEEFLNLDKEYEFVALFGFVTDTYDILGKVLRVSRISALNENEVRKVASVYQGEREQKYPLYSSKMISKIFNQKKKSCSKSPRSSSLPMAARPDIFSQDFFSDDTLEIEIPSKKINIYEMNFHGLDELKAKELFGRLLMEISKVKGNFRQNSILVLWREVLEGFRDDRLYIGRFSAKVSTGTYIRGIISDMGNTLGVGACAFSIKRNKVGDFDISESIR
jgi:tRNA pseudouridine55 synthase